MGDPRRHGRPQRLRSIFVYRKFQETAGAWADVTTSKTETDQPTAMLDTSKNPDTLRKGKINRVHYRLNFANAETYTLRLWAASKTGDYESIMSKLWESAAAQADDIEYDNAELDIPFVLDEVGKIFFSVEWTGAAGNIQGFIEVSGEMYE